MVIKHKLRYVFFILGLLFILLPSLRISIFQVLFPDLTELSYTRESLLVLLLTHLGLVAISTLASTFVGLSLGILITRKAGKPFRALAADTTALAQTFPPAAVIALCVPLLGFGWKPAFAALFLYGILPIFANTVSGLDAVPKATIEAGRGLGMSSLSCLFGVELPLATRVIVAGIRTSLVINVGTATLGATIGAGGLGAPIIAGLVRNNMAFILEGALSSAFLALSLDALLSRFDHGRTTRDTM
ncbi:ABC transporter permease [Treponema sp.]